MSLVKKPEMTEKNRAAHGRNGRQSRGAATPEGKERSRAANLRHGIYSQMSDEALPALGEDPAELAVLIEGAYEQWRPANASQAQMVERLARLQWRMDRAERRQDNLAASTSGRWRRTGGRRPWRCAIATWECATLSSLLRVRVAPGLLRPARLHPALRQGF